MNLKIAYLINQYPKVSHSFIRRELLELEKHGFDIQRISIRGWDIDLVDSDDISERKLTRYILQGGALPLFFATFTRLIKNPMSWFRCLKAAIRMSFRADRSFVFHLIYMAEACLLLDWLRKSDVSHLHVHFGTNATEVAMLAKILGGPAYSFTIHGPEEFDKPEFLKIAEKVKYASFVVAITSFCRSQVYRWIPYADWPKVKEVHCGLDSSFYDVEEVPITHQNRIVCVGRLCEQKGQLLLIDAVAQLISKGVKLELVLAGDGEMRQQIEQRIKNYGIDSHVRITGWISSVQVRQEIQIAKALILPSFAEGLPVVIMEAMALKRPILTTYVAGIPELVVNAEHGFLFPAGDVDQISEAISKLLTLSPSELTEMGNEAYKKVLERHSIDTEVTKLAQHIKALQV